MDFKDIGVLDSRMPESTLALARNLDDGIYSNGSNRLVSAVLEEQDPTSALDERWAGTDAFQRLLMAFGVRTRDDKLTGVPASTLADLREAGGGRGSVLLPEFIMRTLRVANVFGTSMAKMRDPFGTYRKLYGGDRFYASTNPVSDVLRPSVIDDMIHYDPLRQSLLPLMVATDETVADARDYTGFWLTYTAANSRLHRTSEGAPPPVYELTGGDRTHRMVEFAFEVQFSYKAEAEYQLPLFQLHLALIAGQNDLDKEQVAYETLINGDGTAAAATNTNVSALTGGAASTVKYGNLLEWLRLFEGNGNFAPTIAIGTSAVVHRIDVSDFGSANWPTFAGLQAVLPGQGARPEGRTFPPIYARSYSTANKLLAWDATKSLHMRHTTMLEETDKIISNRTNKIVVSESCGFHIAIDGGRRTLDTEN